MEFISKKLHKKKISGPNDFTGNASKYLRKK